MSQVRKMSNVKVAVQSALAAAATIEAITQADPGVVTITGHGFSNGDYLLLDVQGMDDLDSRVFRVCNSATDTFELEDISGGVGIDTSEFEAFSSGTVQKITFGTSVTTAANIEASGGEFEFIDTSVVHRNKKTQMPGAESPIVKTIENHWDLTDAGQLALKEASNKQTRLAFKFTYGIGGPIEVFVGYVGFSGQPVGAAFQKITSKAVITADADATYYAS